MRKTSNTKPSQGALAYHGPTSIFNSNLIEPPSPIVSSAVSSPFGNSVSALHTPTIRLCIGLFFRWQYTQFMYIDREHFVHMFEEGSTGSDISFATLVYACCAVGALMSSDPEIRAEAAPFAEYSEALLKLERLNAPSTTLVQAILTLAGFNIGSGRIAKGWMLSGMVAHHRGCISSGVDRGHHRALLPDGPGAGLPKGSFPLGRCSQAIQHAGFLLQQ